MADQRVAAAKVVCTVAYALPHRQWLIALELPMGATVADALQLALGELRREGAIRSGDDLAAAPLGIFGQPCKHTALLQPGDWIEIYRPLQVDPREGRRARVARARSRS